jgi:uncharacterized protein (TIGR02996 family)
VQLAEADLLTAVRERPDDREARLVYADWLLGEGDPQGELIRVDDELRQLPEFHPRRVELAERRAEVVCENRDAWLDALVELGLGQLVFLHGFIMGAQLTDNVAPVAPLPRVVAIRTVGLTPAVRWAHPAFRVDTVLLHRSLETAEVVALVRYVPRLRRDFARPEPSS